MFAPHTATFPCVERRSRRLNPTICAAMFEPMFEDRRSIRIVRTLNWTSSTFKLSGDTVTGEREGDYENDPFGFGLRGAIVLKHVVSR